MTTNNNCNMPHLTVKSSPGSSDRIPLVDQAASNTLKQVNISDLPTVNGQQMSQYGSGLLIFTASLPGMYGTTQSNSITQGIQASLNSNVHLFPFYVPVTFSVTKLYVPIVTGLAASTVTMGIYAATASGAFVNCPVGVPLTAGSVATTSSSTLVFATVSATLNANTLYYAAIQASSAVTQSIGVVILNLAQTGSMNLVGGVPEAGYFIYANAYSAGTLPTITSGSLVRANSLYSPLIGGVQ